MEKGYSPVDTALSRQNDFRTSFERNNVVIIAQCVRWIQYRKVSNVRRILVPNKIVDHSDVVGASPVGASPTTSSFST